jgi:hypothetical protein
MGFQAKNVLKSIPATVYEKERAAPPKRAAQVKGGNASHTAERGKSSPCPRR